MIISSIDKAAQDLLHGRPVAIPTETVYGLAAPINNHMAIEQVFKIKKRPFFDPLIVHVADIEMAKHLVAVWGPTADLLAKNFWPGSLSLVMHKNINVSDMISSGLTTVALRCPDHPMALELIRKVGPLAAPSANLFGRTSPTTAQHVEESFSELLILDGGPCHGGIESTVFDVETDTILRPGLITAEEIEEILDRPVGKAESKKSPGHLEHHYMPKAPLVIAPSHATDAEIKSKLDGNFSTHEVKWIELSLDPNIAARELYGSLRHGDKDKAILVIAKLPAIDSGLWEAIWDRLKRAATAIVD